jgi:ubiquinone/menaquinone biosynthesis C-methylase UbiE
VHFRDVDVVSTQARLPLRVNWDDAVVSLSVFEHLPDPFAMAAEIRRVLKPGGTVWIETAFMQPLHADPGHYFNMTLQGLLRTFSGVEIDECGVLPHHVPSQSLRMQLDHILPYMQDGEWKKNLSALLAQLVSDGAALDDAMGPIGRRILAAGVFIRGRNTEKS